MSKFRVIVADCPWLFSDKLRMSTVKRGADDNYDGVLSIDAIKKLDVAAISEDDSVLALWCPSSMIQEGLDVMKSWGFELRQTHIWVKTKINPFEVIKKKVSRILRNITKGDKSYQDAQDELDSFFGSKDNQVAEEAPVQNPISPEDILAFGMGRLFRQTHEVVLIGVKGSVYKHLKNKSQRSVHFYPVTKHSAKPEFLQDMLDKMFPQGKRLEMFARRARSGWTCIGNQCPTSFGEDIHSSIDRLKNHDDENVSARQAL